VVAIEEALVDQAPPQRCVVLVQAPQLEIDLTFGIPHADLEQLGNVVEQDKPPGPLRRHRHDPAVPHEGPEHRVTRGWQRYVLSSA
jgi:hypothetical protein